MSPARRVEPGIGPGAIGAVALALWLAFGSGAAAQSLDDIFGRRLRDNADAALSISGINVVPSETASFLTYESGSGEFDSFTTSQLGGGFAVSESFPLYLEGFVGYSRYDPTLLLSRGTSTSAIPLKWTSVSGTGGIGWEFHLTDHWSLIPMAHVTLGRIQTDSSVAAQVVANRLGLDASFLDGGGITTGGGGGSLSLVYNQRWANDYEVDLSLRHTHIRLYTIGGSADLSAEADAITTALWSRLRIPTGLRLFDRPVRIVTEASGAFLPGDQGEALKTSWLVQGGVGGEIDLEETWVPFVTTTRLVARATYGEELTGFSIGLAASF